MTTSWFRLLPVDDLETGSVHRASGGGNDVALACTREGIFAVGDLCPHAEARMSEGRLRGCRLTCPLHGASFDVRDGRVLGGPADRPLQAYPVRIVDGFVEVLLPAGEGAQRD